MPKIPGIGIGIGISTKFRLQNPEKIPSAKYRKYSECEIPKIPKKFWVQNPENPEIPGIGILKSRNKFALTVFRPSGFF